MRPAGKQVRPMTCIRLQDLHTPPLSSQFQIRLVLSKQSLCDMLQDIRIPGTNIIVPSSTNCSFSPIPIAQVRRLFLKVDGPLQGA